MHHSHHSFATSSSNIADDTAQEESPKNSPRAGHACGPAHVAKIMKRLGLLAIQPRSFRPKPTNTSRDDHDMTPVPISVSTTTPYSSSVNPATPDNRPRDAGPISPRLKQRAAAGASRYAQGQADRQMPHTGRPTRSNQQQRLFRCRRKQGHEPSEKPRAGHRAAPAPRTIATRRKTDPACGEEKIGMAPDQRSVTACRSC